MLIGNSKDSPSTSSSTSQKTGDAEDSDISDVEKEGYCDDSLADNIQIHRMMRLKPVTEDRIKQLYHNTDEVL